MTPSSPTRGIALMVLAMALFAVADTFVKLVAVQLPTSHTLILLLGGTGFVFAVIGKLQGGRFNDPRAWTRVMLVRYFCEILGTFGLVLAFASVPLSTVGALIQATPLVVMLGAVVVLHERVLPSQWIAILVGFAGVLMVVQPTPAGFDGSVLWAVVAMLGLSGRDLCTRLTPAGLSSGVMASYTMLVALPFALIWSGLSQPTLLPPTVPWLQAAAMVLCGAAAYLLLIASIRAAPVSVVTPFRYTRLIFLLGFGIVIFGERPTLWVYLGSALIVVSGIAAMGLARKNAA